MVSVLRCFVVVIGHQWISRNKIFVLSFLGGFTVDSEEVLVKDLGMIIIGITLGIFFALKAIFWRSYMLAAGFPYFGRHDN